MKICRRYKSLVASYVDGTATAEERAALDRHLRVCRACTRATRELVRTRRLVTGLPALKPSRRLMAAISSRLRERPVGWLERLWWSFRPADWRLPVTAAVLVVCIAVGAVILHGPMGTPNRPDEQLYVAQPHARPPEIVSESPRDDYVTSCVLIHESFDHNRVFGTPDEVQVVSYGQ
jgi:anti-sigma factor RsiW